MTRINRDFFFDHLHDRLYPNGVSQPAVDGHEAILDEWEAHHAASDDRWLAYILATAHREAGPAMQPVSENLNYSAQRLTASLPWALQRCAGRRLRASAGADRQPRLCQQDWKRQRNERRRLALPGAGTGADHRQEQLCEIRHRHHARQGARAGQGGPNPVRRHDQRHLHRQEPVELLQPDHRGLGRRPPDRQSRPKRRPDRSRRQGLLRGDQLYDLTGDFPA